MKQKRCPVIIRVLSLVLCMLVISCDDGSPDGPAETNDSADTVDSTPDDTDSAADTATSSGNDPDFDSATGMDTASGMETDSTPPIDTDIVENPFDDDFPAAGYATGGCAIPADAGLEDSSNPTSIIGTGTPASCTSEAVVAAVANGGIITFNCGPDPVTIVMKETAKIVNNTGPVIVIDGGGKVALSGEGERRILYMNTCDENQVWTTSACQNQDHPRLTVQNLTFVDGNSSSETEYDGGGAIWVRGGRFKVVNSRFFGNTCASEGPDVGGAAIRVFSQYEGLPVYVVNSTFGGRDDLGNSCSNGGGISSIGVSWSIYNSEFSFNSAIGNGGNPQQSGTPGGGSGGAIYNDGNEMTLSLCGVHIENNTVNAYGDAIFFVSNNHTGNVAITDSLIRNNTGGSWHALPGISAHDDTPIDVTNSVIE